CREQPSRGLLDLRVVEGIGDREHRAALGLRQALQAAPARLPRTVRHQFTNARAVERLGVADMPPEDVLQLPEAAESEPLAQARARGRLHVVSRGELPTALHRGLP